VAAAVAAGLALCAGAALGLLEELREDTSEGHDEADEDKGDGCGAPEADVAGGAGDLREVGKREREGDEGENADGGGENVEVASHGAGISLARAGPVFALWAQAAGMANKLTGLS
jgi:hypothetical protein